MSRQDRDLALRSADAKRKLMLFALAALLSFPWVAVTAWFRSGLGWAVALLVYFAELWLLNRLTYPFRLQDLEERLAGLERREAVRRLPPPGDEEDGWVA